MHVLTRREWADSHAERFVRFDNIRILKLYELIQYTLLTIPFAWLGSSMVVIFLKDYALDPSAYTVGQLIFAVFWAVLMVVFMAYYIPKLVMIFPPFFLYQETGYTPSLKNEARTGIGIAFGMFFFGALAPFRTVVDYISRQIYPFAWKTPPAH